MLKQLTKLSNSRLVQVLDTHKGRRAITASSIGDLITEDFVDEYKMASEIFWGYLVEKLDPFSEYMALSSFYDDIMKAIEGSASIYRGQMVKLLANYVENPTREPIFGEFRSGSGVQAGDMRPVLSAMGNGSQWAQVQLAGGPASGKIVGEWMSANGIGVEQKIWIYGEASRRTFNGHLQLDGLVFDDWNDDALEISPQDAWLRISTYFPGDHFGCGCIVAPYIPNFGPDFTLSLSVPEVA